MTVSMGGVAICGPGRVVKCTSTHLRQETFPWSGEATKRGSNLDLGTYCYDLLEPLSDLRIVLDLCPDCSAVPAHQALIQIS